MIQFKLNLKDLKLAEYIFKEEKKAVFQAAKKALNRTMTSTQKQLITEVRKVLRLKPSEIKQRYLAIERARGRTIDDLSGAIKISSEPVSMIRLVVGPPTPRSQSGIPVKGRKALKVEITPGRKVKTKYFIARGKQGNMQVFSRRPGTKQLVKQAVPSVGHHVINKNNGEILNRLREFASRRMNIEFEREHSFAFEKLRQKRNFI